MESEFDLLLSPHPDDLVYSAFSLLTDRIRPKHAVILFNKSVFTKFGLLPKALVTLARTVEDRIAMGAAGSGASYRFLPDSVVRSRGHIINLESLLRLPPRHPSRIIAPLGVGGNPDHILVRDSAIEFWQEQGRSELCLYEDMPYAARSTDLRCEEASILGTLKECGLHEVSNPLSSRTMRRKVLFSRLYVTQTDKSEVLARHAAQVGSESGTQFAERFFRAPSSNP